MRLKSRQVERPEVITGEAVTAATKRPLSGNEDRAWEHKPSTTGHRLGLSSPQLERPWTDVSSTHGTPQQGYASNRSVTRAVGVLRALAASGLVPRIKDILEEFADETGETVNG